MWEEGKVEGRRLKWAREQQRLTMREVQERGGPAPGYQSEVENGTKSEVSAEKLYGWCRALGVTPAFARGQIPRLEPSNPGRCRGLAGWVEPEIRQNFAEFEALLPPERVRRVLRTIANSNDLPTVVLAFVLSLELPSLLNLLYDSAVFPTEYQMRQAAVLIAVTTRLFRFAELCPDD